MATGQPRVMIVDDDIIMHDVLKMMLQPSFELRMCFNVRQAREVLESWHPDVICVDLMMPGENGLVLLDYAKHHTTLRDVPFVVISASSDDVFFNEARRLGAHSLVFKPFSRIDLIRAIETALEAPDA
jgi:CheY-like chemotaxis protein